MKSSLVLAVLIFGVATSVSAEPASRVCRRAFSKGETPISQVSVAIGKIRKLYSCLAEKGGDKMIVIVETNGAASRTLIPPRLYFSGEVVSTQTFTVVEQEDSTVIVPHPAYTMENPIRIDEILRPRNLFAISSEYAIGDSVGSAGAVTEVFEAKHWPSKSIAYFDGGGWSEGGDYAQRDILISTDSKGLSITDKNLYSDDSVERLNFVDYRLVGDSLVAVSTRSCVHTFREEDAEKETAILKTGGGICDDLELEHCLNRPDLRFHIVDTTGMGAYKVMTSDGKRGFVEEDKVVMECPSVVASTDSPHLPMEKYERLFR